MLGNFILYRAQPRHLTKNVLHNSRPSREVNLRSLSFSFLAIALKTMHHAQKRIKKPDNRIAYASKTLANGNAGINCFSRRIRGHSWRHGSDPFLCAVMSVGLDHEKEEGLITHICAVVFVGLYPASRERERVNRSSFWKCCYMHSTTQSFKKQFCILEASLLNRADNFTYFHLSLCPVKKKLLGFSEATYFDRPTL